MYLKLKLDSSNTRVLQKVLSLGSDYFSAMFIKHIFITNLQSIPPLLKHIFVSFLPSHEKQINSLLLVETLINSAAKELLDIYLFPESIFLSLGNNKKS